MSKFKFFLNKHGYEILLSAILPILFWGSFLKYPFRYLQGDYDLAITYLFANKISFLYYHEFPYFSSYIGGGFFLWPNPQTMFFSVPQLISLFFNNQWLAIRISVCVLSSISMLGMFKLLKQLEIENFWCRLFGAIVYTFSGFMASHLTIGHIAFHSIIYIPWLAAAFVWSDKNDKFSFIIPIWLAVMVYAGQNITSIFILFILLSFIMFTKLKRFALYLFLGGLLSLPKIVSSYELLSWFPKNFGMGYAASSWQETLKILLKALIWTNQQSWENNGYVGILVLILSLVCVFKYKSFIKQRKYITSMFIIIGISLFFYPGDLNPICRFLSKDLILSFLHIPTRFIGLLALPLACLSSFGLFLSIKMIKKYANIILIGICIFIFWHYIKVNKPFCDYVQNSCTIKNNSYFKKKNSFIYVKGPDWSFTDNTRFECDFMSTYLQKNEGVLQFFESLFGYDAFGFLRRSSVRSGDLGLFVRGPNTKVNWISPSKINIEVIKTEKESIEIPININYFPGWQITDKKEGMTLNKEWSPSKWGLLTLRLDEKFPLNIKEEIILKYSPSLIVKISFILMISTLILLIYFKVRNK